MAQSGTALEASFLQERIFDKKEAKCSGKKNRMANLESDE